MNPIHTVAKRLEILKDALVAHLCLASVHSLLSIFLMEQLLAGVGEFVPCISMFVTSAKMLLRADTKKVGRQLRFIL